jgi:hypothetical protein
METPTEETQIPATTAQKSEEIASEKTITAAEFLQQETKRIKRRVFATWFLGGALVVGVGVYLTWLYGALTSVFLDPMTLAATISGTVSEHAPEYVRNVEEEIKDQAPTLSANVSSQVTTLLPKIRQKGEAQVDHVLATMPTLKTELADVIQAYIVENEKELKDFYSSHSEEEFATYFLQNIKTQLTRGFEEHLRQESGLGLSDVKSLSLARLTEINNYLVELRNKSRYRMTRSEALQRRVIATWLELLSEMNIHFEAVSPTIGEQ